MNHSNHTGRRRHVSARQGRSVITRRAFMRRAAAMGTVWTIVPREVLGAADRMPPSERVTIACIGVGCQGIQVMRNYLEKPDVQIVAVCDVNRESGGYSDWGTHATWREADPDRNPRDTGGREPARRIVDAFYTDRARAGAYKGCTAYQDYRELLEREQDVDAVIVATPDHAHALVSVAAMRAGKHVHCQKPMTHTVYEARRMAEVARETRVATQVFVGNQASEATRVLCEWIWDGAIGKVREVHNWSNRPIWPQGLERPSETPPVPDGLNWDLWLGPSPERPFHPAYLPLIWRGWYDFGTGALGDMGCYSFDTIFRVLKLGPPEYVEACSSPLHSESFPLASVVRYRFPGRGDMPAVALTWYDGGLKPARPAELEPDRPLAEEGLLFVGDEGKILCDFTGESARIIPKPKMDAYDRPPETLPRSIGHDDEWLQACKGGEKPGANFEFVGPVTEALLLGNVALRIGRPLEWDCANLKVTNISRANDLLHMPYRNGWTL